MTQEVAMSLADSAVAVMLPIAEAGRSREFYGYALGLPYQGTDPQGEMVFELGGGSQLVLRVQPDAKPSPHTAMSFRVDDVAAEVQELEGRGVKFEDYDLPGLKTVGHIAESEGMKAAWFLDPDGNVLCLHQPG